MKLVTIIVLLLTLVGCKESPNYNPFDDQFDVSVRDIINDGCDTISAGCGYYNLLVSNGRFRPYYQVYYKDFYKIEAKGFIYVEDTFIIRKQEDAYSVDFRDSLQQHHFDSDRFNKAIAPYGYQILSKSWNRINIINNSRKDTLELRLSLYEVENDSTYEWGVSHYQGNIK